MAQSDGQAISEKGEEEVRFNTFRGLMKNGAQAQVTFQGAEGLFHKDQLHVTAPDEFRIIRLQIGAQQVAAFAPASLTQSGPIQVIRQSNESLLRLLPALK